MEHPFALSNINASLFSSHLLELIIMLTGTIIISFVAGRMFSKNTSKDVMLVKEDTAVTLNASSDQTVFIEENEIDKQKTAEQILFGDKEKAWQEQLLQSENELQQSRSETGLLKEEKEVLSQQVNQLYDCLKQQLNDLKTVAQFKEAVGKMEASIVSLQEENKLLANELAAYKNGVTQHDVEKEQALLADSKGYEIVVENESLVAQLKQVESEKEKLAYAVVSLQEQVYAMQAVATENGAGEQKNEGKESLVKMMEEKVQILQKERNDLMGQISQLENQLKITHLTSLSKVDMEQEEENPIKRLTLYIRMVEGEKQGLNNKIADMSKKLNQAEASLEQIQAKELELTYVKSRLAALEKDKRDVQSQSGEWEVMYKKLHEKTHYLLSAKETELEQFKTTISYLEKDKNRLQARIADMEAELRSSVFNYKGRSPLAFNL